MAMTAILLLESRRDAPYADDSFFGERFMTESELIIRLRARDQNACAAWVREHHGRLVAVARAIVGDAQAEEAVQEAWIAAFRSITTRWAAN